MHCIDTPSFNGKLHDPRRVEQIGALLPLVAAGVDAFLFVVKCTRYRYDNTVHQTLQTYQSLLTPAFWPKVILVFTHATPELLPASQSRLPLVAWAREIQESFNLPSPPLTVFAMDYVRFPYPSGGAQDFWERLMELDANTQPYCHKPFLESIGNGIAVEGYVQRIKGHLALFEPAFFEDQAEGQYKENEQKKRKEGRFSLFRNSTKASGSSSGKPSRNTLFFQLSVPLLYQSPFLLVRVFGGDKLPWDKFKRQVKLLWVLLCSVIHHPWVAEALPPFSNEYPTLFAPGHQQRTSLRGKELTVDYLQYYTHQDHAQISDAFPTLFPSLICYHMDQWSGSQDMQQIRSTVERAFLMQHTERIQSLSVPMLRTRIFWEAAPRLTRLKRVEFFDIKLDFDSNEAIKFLKRHRLHQHGNNGGGATDEIENSITSSLTEVKLGGTSDSGIIEKPDLYIVLQAMDRPKVIDLTGWRGAIMDITHIPVQTVRSLLFRLDRPLSNESPIQKVLESARDLRSLQLCIAPTHGDLFRWAVEKRRASLAQQDRLQTAREQARPMIPARLGSSSLLDIDSYATSSSSFAGSLEELSLAGETPAIVWALMGAAEAYADTLDTLKASSWKRPRDVDFGDEQQHHQDHSAPPGAEYFISGNPAQPQPQPTLPQFQQHASPSNDIPRLCFTPIMTRLSHLELKGEVAASAFEFRSLSHCPKLQVLRLNTHPCGKEPSENSLTRLLDNVPRSLQELELTGPWFVTDQDLDRMSKVSTLPDLRRLLLVHCRTSRAMTVAESAAMMLASSFFDDIPATAQFSSPRLRTTRRTMSDRLTTRGLYRAIKNMVQLRELRLGLEMEPEEDPEEVAEADDDNDDDDEADLEWSSLPLYLKRYSQSRILPLHLEMQHFSL
ncbi:hypothetical protein BGZ83_006756 [Gryganskiella cystojenkinii]|nr:hypothetical protein BGZ83_006756 [Gryganskiella cystojenkinii]